MLIVGEEGKGSVCGKATKGAPTKGAGMPYKGKNTERRKKVEKNRGRRGSACGQAMRSIARVEKELSGKIEKESREAL